MKRNKLAAGALALALGLGAVAPSFADSPAEKIDAVKDVETNKKGYELFLDKYDQELAVANKYKAQYDVARAEEEKATKRLTDAETRLRAAEDAWKKLDKTPSWDRYQLKEAERNLAEYFAHFVKRPTAPTTPEVNKYEGLSDVDVFNKIREASEPALLSGASLSTVEYQRVLDARKAEAERVEAANEQKIQDEYDRLVGENRRELVSKVEALRGQYGPLIDTDKVADLDAEEFDALYSVDRNGQYQWTSALRSKVTDIVSGYYYENLSAEDRTQIDRYVNAYQLTWKEYYADPVKHALQELHSAEAEYDAAKTQYKRAKAAFDTVKVKYERTLNSLKSAAEGYNLTIQVGNNGIQVVKPGDAKVDGEKAEKELDLVALQEAIDRANVTLESVEVLKKVMPNFSKLNATKLESLVADQKATIARAEAIIAKANKKVALISTAYAAEEEVTSEDVDALIKELDDNTNAIQGELNKLDGEVKDEEKAPANDDKKDDEKPADEDKKDDDKKEDTADDKKEDKADDKKVDTTKVVNKSANKTAGSNAKTGIAGVAGVAGVLAAASVAYAASKKNN